MASPFVGNKACRVTPTSPKWSGEPFRITVCAKPAATELTPVATTFVIDCLLVVLPTHMRVLVTPAASGGWLASLPGSRFSNKLPWDNMISHTFMFRKHTS